MIDSSIYGLIQQPKFQTPMDTFGGAMQIKNLVDTSQLQGIQRRELEAGIEREGKLRELFSRGNVKPEEVFAIDPKTGMTFQKNEREARETRAKLEKTEVETRAALAKYGRDGLAQVRDQMTYDAWRADAESKGIQVAKTAPAIFDPAWQRQNIMDADKFIAQSTPKFEKVDIGGRIEVIDVNPITNPSIKGTRFDKTMSPGDTARLGELQAHNLEMERQGGDRQFYETGIRPPGRQVTIGQPAPRQAAPTAPAPVQPVAPRLTPRQEAEMAATEAKRKTEVGRTLNMYIEGRNGLLGGLGGSATGPVVGRMPAVTSGQQIAEGSVSAMAPILKQLFRVSGEGVFTDRDQELLLNMVPTRADSPEARKSKMENIDRIVAAKLGMEVPPYTPKEEKPVVKTFDAMPDPAKFNGKRIKGEDGTIYKSNGRSWVRQ